MRSDDEQMFGKLQDGRGRELRRVTRRTSLCALRIRVPRNAGGNWGALARCRRYAGPRLLATPAGTGRTRSVPARRRLRFRVPRDAGGNWGALALRRLDAGGPSGSLERSGPSPRTMPQPGPQRTSKKLGSLKDQAKSTRQNKHVQIRSD